MVPTKQKKIAKIYSYFFTRNIQDSANLEKGDEENSSNYLAVISKMFEKKVSSWQSEWVTIGFKNEINQQVWLFTVYY